MLDCSGLLVGDTGVVDVWPDKAKGMPGELAELVHSVRVSFQVGRHAIPWLHACTRTCTSCSHAAGCAYMQEHACTPALVQKPFQHLRCGQTAFTRLALTV